MGDVSVIEFPRNRPVELSVNMRNGNLVETSSTGAIQWPSNTVPQGKNFSAPIRRWPGGPDAIAVDEIPV